MDENREESYNLEPIIEYSMNEEEALAYKLGLVWITLSRKLFPNHKHSSNYPKKGDPRRGSLFKYCYKLVRETKGLIPPQDYKYYIAAQLQIFKSIEAAVLITPQCLVGDKAWIRWKMWKRKFDNINKVNKEEVEKCGFPEIKSELEKTKKFLDSKFGELNEERISILKKDFERYITLGQISGFYAVLSPHIQKYCNLENVDLVYYKNNITEAAQEYFNNLFLQAPK